MATFERLSVRRGVREPDEVPHEGIPGHVRASVLDWIREYFEDRTLNVIRDPTELAYVLSTLRVPVPYDLNEWEQLELLLRFAGGNEDDGLDVVDLLLAVEPDDARHRRAVELENVLMVAGSAWRVADDYRALERRLDVTTAGVAAHTMSPVDAASTELRSAWAAAYGRNPDPSDAWDHAIKAVEEILKPIITPTQPGATLGAVVGQLRGQPHLYEVTLQDNNIDSSKRVDSVQILEQSLHLIWPNPDRHGGTDKRTPSLAEARGVVQQAVLVVQWARDGLIKKR